MKFAPNHPNEQRRDIKMLSLRVKLTEEEIETARLMTQATVSLSANRNRIFESLLAQQAFLDALWDYMEEQDLNFKTYQIEKELSLSNAFWRRELFDISDVCVNGWRVDIRRIRQVERREISHSGESQFVYISKNVATSPTPPDAYAVVVLTFAQKMADAELIGWFSHETLEGLSSETVRDEFYKIPLEKLEPPLRLLEQLKQPVEAAFHELKPQSQHLAEQVKMPSFFMKPLSDAPAEARNHLFLCQECATEYIAALQSREQALQVEGSEIQHSGEHPEHQHEHVPTQVTEEKGVFSSDGIFAHLIESLDPRRFVEELFSKRAGQAFAADAPPEVMVLHAEDTSQDVPCRKGKLTVEADKGLLLRIGRLPENLVGHEFMMFIVEKEIQKKIANVLRLTDEKDALRKAFSRQNLDKNFEVARLISRLPALNGQVSEKYREIRVSKKVAPAPLPSGTIIVVLIA
jgi:hypothetical protein